MQNSGYRLLLSILFVAATALAGCGDNSQLVGNQNNDPSSNNKNNDNGNNGDNGNNDDTPDAGFDAGDDAGPDADDQLDPPTPDAGDPDDTSEPTDPCLETTPAEAAAFADEYAETLCERIFQCDQNPKLALYVTMRDWTDIPYCKADLLAGGISVAQAQAAAENASLTLNSCEAEACLPSLATADCDGLERILEENYVEEISSCYSAWNGALPEAADCTVDAQCAGHQICEREANGDSCTGVCVDAGPVGSGQCGDNICRPDQYCSGDNDICMTRPDAGEACDSTKVCRTNATCQNGTCVAVTSRLQEGEACNLSDKLCDFELICLSGTCTNAAGLDEACNFMGCQNGLYCSAGSVCKELGGAGASCSQDAECRTNRCVSGSCTDVDSLCN